MASKDWREVNAIYQIYPRSFKDSNGDGIGDIRGVINQLDYIKGNKNSLGIDAIWFSPIFKSPMADMGYDVSDYCDIDPLFGTLDDFKELISKAHSNNINVMLDFVPNHTSDEHPWFSESSENRTNDKADYYVWANAKADGSAPNNWRSIFGGSAWEWNGERKQYYLHTFLKEQPDLNWANEDVRSEMKQVLRFWMDLGVDGIRADAVRFISKDPEMRDNFDCEIKDTKFDTGYPFATATGKHSEFGPQLFDYLRDMTDVMSEYDNRIIIFEDYPNSHYSTKEQYMGFYSINPKVGMPFNFEGVHAEFNSDKFRLFITEFQGMLDQDEHRPVYCFGNHDQGRLASRYGGSEQARLVALMQLSLPGLPTVYYGDELGLPNTPITKDEIRDLSAFTVEDGSTGRDPERTPMQWNTHQYAGFSDVKPWLPIGEDYKNINVDTQTSEPDSFLSLYRRLLKLRTKHNILRNGSYETFGERDKNIFVFSRRLKNEHLFVALNFSNKTRTFKMPRKIRVLCCTHPVDYPELNDDNELTLRPYEGVLAECAVHPLESSQSNLT